jgi:hypothetical protein
MSKPGSFALDRRRFLCDTMLFLRSVDAEIDRSVLEDTVDPKTQGDREAEEASECRENR